MKTRKLTLSAPEDVIEKAKRVAAEQGTSVSAMFARMVAAADAPRGQTAIGPITRGVSGLIQLPADRSDQGLLEDALTDRYGSGR